MYPEVSPTGAKYWRMRFYRPSGGKEEVLAFGVFPGVSLADAREKRDSAKKLLSQGINPKEANKLKKAEDNGDFHFETIARKWHARQKIRWSEYYSDRWLRSLGDDSD